MVYPGEERRECKENDGRGGEMDSQSVPLHPHWSLWFPGSYLGLGPRARGPQGPPEALGLQVYEIRGRGADYDAV